MIVTIDGVAASGKSSVAARVAQQLNLPFVSSGLLYRAVARLALKHDVPTQDQEALLRLLDSHALELRPYAQGNEVWCEGEDLTHELHTAEVDAAVSRVAQHSQLRAWVNEQLRALPEPFVVEGRDMGTAVFPQASVKFYLTASARVRAERRAGERTGDVDAVEAALRERDRHDAAQSRPAPDALLLDTSNLSLDEVVSCILKAVPA
ncbi:(d)CMP kinase [Deinococcus peraridilitoris]|uniref:(d)CMP kinase n=1 Tax=Deinococcus peraridilitoris TaxID=432329 RepID=UPI00059C09E4|nr:(d)CMP kinase [Deinococcus peraridilitoris]